MAHDVFISYASEDRLTADAACHALEARGIRCWIAPRDVPPGRAYPEALVDAIQGARVMVLVFSSSANQSKHVPKEVERAASAGIPILPIRIESVKPVKSLLFFLGSVHWLDALTPPVEKNLERLADAVNALIARTGEAPLPPPPPKPIPGPSPALSARQIMMGAGAIVLVLGALAIWRLSPLPASRSPLPAPAPVPAPSAPLPAPRSPLPVAPSPLPTEVVVGRWRWYNGGEVDVRDDGTFSAGPFSGTWRQTGAGRYSLTWPAAVDRVTLSDDGGKLGGGNQYGIKLTAQRISGDPSGLPGSWLWWNGATFLIAPNGVVIAGPHQARWAAAGGRDFTITWAEPVDQVTVSSDRQRMSGANQFGFSLTASRIGN